MPLALGVVLLALGVEPEVEQGPGDVPSRSGGRVVRFGHSTTAVAAGDLSRCALAYCFRCTLAEAFVLGLRAGMLECVSREDGRNAEEPEKIDQARKGDNRHDGDNIGAGVVEVQWGMLSSFDEDCVDI